jgi:hypothetical protein
MVSLSGADVWRVLGSSLNHGSIAFWWVMTAIGCVELVVVGVLAYRQRDRRNTARYRRYVRGFWGFAAWTSLCLVRIALLSH